MRGVPLDPIRRGRTRPIGPSGEGVPPPGSYKGVPVRYTPYGGQGASRDAHPTPGTGRDSHESGFHTGGG